MNNVRSFILAHTFIIIPVLAIVAFFAARAILLQKPSTDILYTVKRESLVDTAAVSGSYMTAAQTSVISPTNGVIDMLSVKNGDTVKKGDLLFHVESSASEDQQKVAYAAYLAAVSTLKADTAQLYTLQSTMFSKWKIYDDLATNSTYQNSDGTPNNTNRILTEFSSAQDNWFAAEQNYKNQQAVIDKDNASVASTKLTYDETQSVAVKAITNGTIVNLQKSIGDQVAAPVAPGTSAESVLVIADLTNPYLSATITEGYASRIAAGQGATIVFDALKTKKFAGKVESIDTVGIVQNGVATYKTRITIEDDLTLVKPGMTALITIETLRKDHVLAIPNSAIVEQNGKTYVRLADHTLTEVSLGTQGITKTEVTGGISEDAVIVANP